MKRERRPIAVLKLGTKVSDFLRLVRAILAALTGNPAFASPTPSLATVSSAADALDAAQTLAKSRAHGSAAARNAKLKALRTLVEELRQYVQGVADPLSATDAASLIQSAGMATKKVTLHNKADLAAVHGPVSGAVDLVAKAAGPRSAYDWQYSVDQHTWTSLPTTVVAKTVATGLTAGTIYYFRVRSTTNAGVGNWGQIVNLLVQ